MVLDILETTGDDDALDALITRATADMATSGADEAGDQAGERFILVTPARLRSYAERQVLEHLGAHPTGKPGVTLEVHSFTSMARSVIGNRYDGRYTKPVVSPFTLRAFLATRMRHDPQTFRTAGETFGSANQFAAQVTELLNAGIRPHDITGMPDADERMLALAKLLALVEDEFGNFTMPGANASVIVPWAEDHGDRLHVYLYGFEWMTADEMLATMALAKSADCVVCTEEGCRPDFVNTFAANAEHSAGESFDELPPLRRPTAGLTAYRALDECDEVRQAAALIELLHEQAAEDGEPFSYGDVLITARNLEPYQALLADEFAYHGIPVNMTSMATMADQPFAKLLLSLLDERLYGKVPDATVLSNVFRSHLLRGQYRVSNRDLDRVEDALYSYDPVKVWDCGSNSIAVNNTIARMHTLIAEAYPVFMENEHAETRTVRETLGGMIRFLVRIGANLSWTEIVADDAHAAESNDAHVRRGTSERLFSQTRIVWNLVMREFDELVDRFGDEPFNDFRPTFRANLETLLLEQPLHDQARASNAVDVIAFPTPMRPYRHVFVLGATESQLPAIPSEAGLLDESERLRLADSLARHGNTIAAVGLRSGIMQSKARREVLAFNRVTRYAQDLTAFCPGTAGGAAQALSPFVAALLVTDNTTDADERIATPTINDLPTTFDDLSHPLTLRTANNGNLDPGIMLDLFTRPSDPNDISSPRVLDTSVSAVQGFYANPFDTFLLRGLKLQPVKPFELDSATKGSFYHAVLERLIDVKIAAQHCGDNLSALPTIYRNGNVLKSDTELIDLLAQLDFQPEPIAGSPLTTASLLEENPEFAILDCSHRMNAVHGQLKNTLRLFLQRLDLTVESWQTNLLDATAPAPKAGTRSKNTDQVIAVHDTPLFTEKQFGDIHGTRADWPAVTSRISGAKDGLPVNVTVQVRGKVDRIERIERNGLEGSLVIDYKSSPHTLFDANNKTELGTLVYYGHELQLLNYARAIMASGEDLPPVMGMVFLPIQNTKDAYDIGKLPENGTASGERTRTIGDTGLELPSLTALNLTTAGTLVSPWERGKAASLPRFSLSPENLRLLVNYVRRMIDQACRAMLSGNMPVAPYRALKSDASEAGRDGLKYSDYRDVMALDLLDDRAWRMQSPVLLGQLVDAAKDVALPDLIGGTTVMTGKEEEQ
ncbi:PD-(D/E)XK nuclease superfamily [Bifidobacterium ramosum]|nr:PD-(D/E)XK nuclease family protein [Bifidobacterium ramosum]KAB8287114.1 PD-(D/E)XK nuclease superfamily [Bifidobacterium ramosum]